MAYCNQTLAGITLDCTNSMGGIKTVYIANYGDVEDVKVGDVKDGEDGEITSIVMGLEIGPDGEPIKDAEGNNKTAKFKPYQFRKQTGSMTSTLNVDETTGLNYVSTELNLVFTKMETAKRMEIAALSIGQLAVIVEDCNGVFYYLGKDDYVSASAGGAQTGTSKSDANSYTLTLKDESKSYPYIIDASVLDTVIEK